MTRIIQTGAAVQQQGAKLTTLIPLHIRRSGGRKVVIPAATSADPAAEHHTPILTALSRAFHWQRLLDEGIVKSGSDIARQEGLNPTTVWELLRLTLLSPTNVQAILAGRQPRTLTLRWLKNHELPADWEAQREVFSGFDTQSEFEVLPVGIIDSQLHA
ncbi:MAG: hypothetical protein CRU78_13610 [Candidatus Accumulibacter phosphatis]|jgi:hypothetical protein|uniref:Bacteriophage-related protein n=1 Tax=Candidatus Accumulibacter phosphatis TaxID=327160 RepID=A0A6A7RVA4_9PROT|nr:hypothetical protein [Candidatus Accumulibacter phosphatis]